MLPNNPRSVRPMSEIINPNRLTNEDITGSWFEDLKNYERNLDEIASTTLDLNFQEDMQHVDQWYRYLTEAEKTATMYTLLQHSTQVQVRFFINILQQMIKRDSLYSLLTPNNPDQDMHSHLAKAELEASQRLMSVLPYKTGQVVSRPSSSTNRRAVDRHSFALGDTEEYNRLFSRNDLLNNRSPFTASILDEPTNTNPPNNTRRIIGARNTSASGRTGNPMFNNNSRPHSVIEGDSSSIFPSASWLNSSSPNHNNNNNSNGNSNNNNQHHNTTNINSGNVGNLSVLRRTPGAVGHIGDRKPMPERPKSADITNWSLPVSTDPIDRRASNGFQSVWTQQRQISESDNELLDFTNSIQQPFRRRAGVNRIPVVPETDELIRSTNELYLDDNRPTSFHKQPPGMEHFGYLMNQTPILDGNSTNFMPEEHEYTSDHSEGSQWSRRRSSMTPTTRATKDKKAVEIVDMELLRDVPAWLRSLRLHKYNPIFSDSTWQEMVKMSDNDLLHKGVAALGARRKMLKVFENVKAHCEANNIEY
ncbi:hypothetical protein BDB01DRAFT_830432 [Pilobolus umbonatus]|nr:hypothetical protein BDB01DRAFT_830432 [Pilobolus umbonatus]